MKKQGKLIAIGLVLLAFVVFFMTRPVREKACPLTKDLANDPEFATKCTEVGAVVKDGKCTCPE
jgi:hypothetical protein